MEVAAVIQSAALEHNWKSPTLLFQYDIGEDGEDGIKVDLLKYVSGIFPDESVSGIFPSPRLNKKDMARITWDKGYAFGKPFMSFDSKDILV